MNETTSMPAVYEEFCRLMAPALSRLRIQAVAAGMVGLGGAHDSIQHSLDEIEFAVNQLKEQLFHNRTAYIAIYDNYAIKYEEK